MVYGARASLMAGLVSVLIALAVGVPFGLAAGYFGGWTDSCISRATEALLAIPFLILAIALAAFLGPSLMNAMIAIGVSAAPKFIRLTRGQVLAVKSEDYVQSARALGASDLRIIARHVFPNVMPPLIVQATITIATAIIAEASLSFLGLGLQPPNPSWGSMLNTAKNFDPGAVDVDLPRIGHLPGGAGLQPAGRRAARRAGSAPGKVIIMATMDSKRVVRSADRALQDPDRVVKRCATCRSMWTGARRWPSSASRARASR